MWTYNGLYGSLGSFVTTRAFMRTNRITSMSTLPLFSLTQSRREDTSVNTGRSLKANPSRYCSRSVDNSRAKRTASHESAV